MTGPATPDRVGDFAAPWETADLIGHEAAERTLLQAYAGGRLPHGWLIAGPRGIGKATLAYRFARFLLARGDDQGAGRGAGQGDGLFGPPDSLALAPDDPVFRRVAAGGHGNLMVLHRVINPKNDKFYTVIRIDDVRRLAGFFGQTAAINGWRVVIVDAADDLNLNAQNGLLKALEEPPARAVMLLVAHAPGRLLATIRSRAAKLVLNPLPDQAVATLVAHHLPDLAPEAAQVLARLAAGSPGRALELAASGGLELYGDILGLLAQCPAIDANQLHDFAERFGPRRREAERAFTVASELVSGWLVRLIRELSAPPAGPPVTPREGDLNRRLARAGNLARWIEVWEKVGRLSERAAAVALDRRGVALDIFFAVERAARG